MYEVNFIFSLIVALILFTAVYLILKESRSEVNYSFSISIIMLAIGTLSGSFGYLIAFTTQTIFSINYIYFWQFGIIALILAPIGFFITASIIYYGKSFIYRFETIIWVVISIFVFSMILVFYPRLSEFQNIVIWDSVFVIFLFGNLIEYYKIYLLDTKWKGKILVMMLGLLVSCTGMIINNLMILSFNESSLFREIFPLIGTFMFVIAFYLIPKKELAHLNLKQIKDQKEEYELLLDLITHDLSNNLDINKLYLDLALDDSKQNKNIENSRQSLLKSINLVKTIKIVMKTKFDHKYNFSSISLIKSILNAKEQTLELFKDEKVDFYLDETKFNYLVNADSLLDNLFLNLFTNAVKYNESEMIKITVSIEIDKNDTIDWIIVSINDNGIGIEDTESLFKRYSQFKLNEKGSGLGLFIVSSLIKRFNGKIQVSSNNKGSTFKIWLPAI